MGERLHPEEVPITLAQFESWLKDALEGLKKDLDFYHNAPGHMEEQAFSDAADLVTQAGIFGLSFVPASVLEELGPPRKGMSPRDAAICIKKCLDWCQAKRSRDEASSSNHRLGNSCEAPEFARNGEAASISTELPKTSPVQTSGNKKAELPKGIQMAYESFKLAEAKTGSELAKKEAYDWLKEFGPAEYQLPAFDTWERYVREGQEHYGTQKNHPRGARSSRSIARQEDIEFQSKKPGEPD